MESPNSEHSTVEETQIVENNFVVEIYLDDVYLNELSTIMDAGRKYPDSEEYINTVWEDTVWLSFYHDYYEDGSPKLTEIVPAQKGFYLSASKIGLVTDFYCFSPENNTIITTINQTPVVFGYRSMDHGPYNPDSHEPSGYYDRYVEQFTLNEIEYELIFS